MAQFSDKSRPVMFPVLSFKVETIDPDTALVWLEDRNHSNRLLRRHTVEAYARDMKRGKWGMTGEAVKFDPYGDLLDGQHRLAACVEAEKEFKTLVAYGVLREVQGQMDSGAVRSFGDQLRFENGEGRPSQLAATLRRVFLYTEMHERVNFKTSKVTHAEMRETLDKNPLLLQIHPYTGTVFSNTGVAHSLLTFIQWILMTEGNPERAWEFVELWSKGSNLPDDSPILRLRERLLTPKRGGTGRPTQTDSIWLALMAYNHWMKGKSLKNRLQLPKGGPSADNFPFLEK